MNRRRSPLLTLLILAVLAAVWLTRQDDGPDTGAEAVEQAYADHRSGVMVQTDGTVGRVLADDREGSPHQRFILELSSGHTVLVAHNLDLAERVPLGEGDRLTVCGQYEWNDRGGVIHWTHHDPDGRRDGGWIEHQGRRYR